MLGLFRPGELEVRPAPESVWVVEAGGHRVILEDGQEARLRAAGRQVEISCGDSAWVASSVRGESRQGGAGEFILTVPGRISRQYRGALEVTVRDGKLVPVVLMDLETAVSSAVAAESQPTALLEALKAQAVVTRSFYLAGRRHRGFDFCDTTHCQFLREPPPGGASALTATLLTRGLVLTYRREVIPALFSRSCGGRTRSLGDAGLAPQVYPYYSVLCEYCLRYARPWKAVLNLADAKCLLDGPPTEAKRLRITRAMGWSTLPGNNYQMVVAGGSVVIRGRGQGHGIGLCQWGASGMAAERATFQEILSHYFPNTSLGWRDD